jgi:hypothetical protein
MMTDASMQRVSGALLVLVVCLTRLCVAITPQLRRGLQRAVVIVVPGLGKNGLEELMRVHPNFRTANGPFEASGQADGSVFRRVTMNVSSAVADDEVLMGLELATGCAGSAGRGARSLTDALRSANIGVGVVTTSCVIDPLIAPLLGSTDVDEDYERSARLVRLAGDASALPDVLVGGRGGYLDLSRVGPKSGRCYAETVDELEACAKLPRNARENRPHIFALLGPTGSVHGGSCQYVPPDKTFTTSGVCRALDATMDALERNTARGWVAIVLLRGLDRAAHANDNAKYTLALREVADAVDVAATRLSVDGWAASALLLVSPYETGGYGSGSFRTKLHTNDGGVLAMRLGPGVHSLEHDARWDSFTSVASTLVPSFRCLTHPYTYASTLATGTTWLTSDNQQSNLVWGVISAAFVCGIAISLYLLCVLARTQAGGIRARRNSPCPVHIDAPTRVFTSGTTNARSRVAVYAGLGKSDASGAVVSSIL